MRRLYARDSAREAADRFLAASPADLPQPSILPSVAAAADRIEGALDRGERIGVFGHDDPTESRRRRSSWRRWSSWAARSIRTFRTATSRVTGCIRS
jgi:hypothetical protein